jgi:hypothetical protein
MINKNLPRFIDLSSQKGYEPILTEKSIKKFALKDDGFYKIKPRTEYPVCWSYPDGYECRYAVKGRALHVTHDNLNKVWLDVYPGIFNGSLLESYEVLIKGDKVESYRRDYPDAQTGFTGMRYLSTSGRKFP